MILSRGVVRAGKQPEGYAQVRSGLAIGIIAPY
jgi:hypothetical protein